MNALATPFARPLRTACACQLAAWLVLSFACRHVWPAGQDGAFWGGLIMAMNLYAMRAIVHRLTPATLAGGSVASAPPAVAARRPETPDAPWPHWLPAALIAAKFVAVLAATAVVVRVVDPSPLGLLAGFATLLIGILGATLHAAWQQKGPAASWTTTPPG